MDKNKCNSCGETKCSCKNKEFTKAVIEIDNPEQITLMRKVVVPASMGDDTTVPPVVGKYHNVLLYYEANHKSYLYSSDGIPTLLANGLTDYEQAVNLPQINGVELIGNKTLNEIGIKAYVFDTVADMKVSTDLVDGDYAQTLGFHTINDGGGATYYITNTGIANEMDVIAIGATLYAHLQYDNEINVKQLGAYGDNTHSDDTFISRGVTLANSTSLPLEIPEGTYKLDNALSMKHLDINCEGYINNANLLTLGANSNGTTKTNVKIARVNDVQIEGSKNGYFNLIIANDITMYSDGNDSTNESQAYNKIEGIECNSFTINGVNNGWINENLINIKRCKTSIIITGDGSYYHNNNRFENICLEGATDSITINYGHDNFISYRGESEPNVTINNDIHNFGNVVVTQYESIYYSTYDNRDIDTNTTLNFIGNQALPNSKLVKIMDINPISIKYLNTDLYIDSNGLINKNYTDEFVASNIDPTKPFTIVVKSNIASQRVFITCYDENNEGIQANVGSTNISWSSTNKRYQLGSDTGKASITYYPTAGVQRIQIRITSGTHPFKYATAYIACPFMNFDDFHNEIDTNKKFASAAPNSSSRYYEVGDIIYNSTPTAGGYVGWVCVTAGNPGTWKAFGSIEA